MSFHYEIPFEIFPAERGWNIFSYADINFIKGDSHEKPLDFYAHLACYLLQREKLPDELYEKVERWFREHPMASLFWWW